MKKIYFCLLVIFIHGCGFSPIYSSKNIMFKIGQINYDMNAINNKLVRSLKSVSNQNAERILDIELSSKKEKSVISKDKSGNAEIFEINIIVDIKILDQEKVFKSKQNYKNSNNNFELKEYESQIEEQIVSEITEDMLIYLQSFR